MTTHVTLPSPLETAQFLGMIVGANVKHESVSADDFALYALAEYVDGSGVRIGFLATDIQAAARLGASLTRIPKRSVDDAIAAGELPDNVQENVSEAFNIASNVFPDAHEFRISLGKVLTGEAASEIFANCGDEDKVFSQVEIPGYGPGCLCIGRA